MLLDQTALCRQADMAESRELKEMKFLPAFMSELENLLFDVYVSLLPSSHEYEQRKQLVQAYNMTVKTTFGNIGGFPSVEAFGSFTMNIFTAKSDLDLSINFDNSNVNRLPRDQAVSVLRRFAKVLRRKQSKGHLSGVLPILSAKVPVLKAVDCKTGIECDISVENKDGISRSFFFSIISSIDERFRVLSFLMKAWAKANDINSSKDHTMNSLSIISLVALHFQTRDPPILPPFSTLLRDGTNLTNLHQLVPEFMNLAKRNKESVAELFVSLLAKLTSVETLWELGLCASNFEGSWISKTWTSKFGSNMNVEDFMDRSQNFARSVGKSEMTKIYDCLRGSLRYLTSSMQGQIETSALATLLFGSISLHTQSNQKHPLPSALEQKRTANESVQKLPIKLIRTLVHTKTTAGTSLKRKEKSTKSALPLVSAIAPANQATINTVTTLKAKPPMETTELKPSIRTHVTNGALKKPRYDKAAGELPPGYHQNQNYVYFPSPMMHPAIPYHLPPLNGIGHMNTSAHQRPPLHRHVPLRGPRPQHPPMAPESSGMFRYYSNPAHPMTSDGRHNPSRFPGHSSNAGYPQVFVPQRSFGSNHP